MSQAQKPWWLLVNKPKGLITTIQDKSIPGERIFVIRGEPVVQGLTWLTCGPLSALAVIGILAGLAVVIDVQNQPSLARIFFISAFLILPALVWGITVMAANRLSAKPLQKIRQAETCQQVIRLNQTEGILGYQSDSTGTELTLPYETIRRVHVTPAIGARDANAIYLTLETELGPIVLLDDSLGSHPQKADLVREIETTLQHYAAKKNPPPKL